MTDVEKFLRAIRITDMNYHPGACKWQDYLTTGELTYFTSKDGARDLMVGIDHIKLKEEVLNLAIENISKYYGDRLSTTKTYNGTVNEIVSKIELIRKAPSLDVAFNTISGYLLSPDSSIQTIKILKGDIKGNENEVTTFSINESVCSYLNELLEYRKNIINKKDNLSISGEKEWLLKEHQYLMRIQELENMVASLQDQLGQTDSPPNR